MNTKIVFTIIAICLFVSLSTLNANEKGNIKKENSENYSVSFSEAFQDSPSYGLVEKMAKDGKGKEYYKGISKSMLGLGIAGVVIASVSFLLLIAGIALYVVGWNYYWGYWWYDASLYNISNYWIMYWAGAALISIGVTFLIIGIAMAVVGFVLANVFSKRAGTVSMYIENRQGIVPTDSSYKNNPAIGLKFSF